MLGARARIDQQLFSSLVHPVTFMNVSEYVCLQGHVSGAVIQFFTTYVDNEHSIYGSVTAQVGRPVRNQDVGVIWNKTPL